MVKGTTSPAGVVDLTNDDVPSDEAAARDERKKRRLAAITKGTKGTARSQVSYVCFFYSQAKHGCIGATRPEQLKQLTARTSRIRRIR